jgi:peptide/nickel transport system substrate-binding protein
MNGSHVVRAARRLPRGVGVFGLLIVLLGAIGCRQDPRRVPPSSPTLRVGIGALPQQTSQAGLRQLFGNLSIEGLINLTDEGRPREWLAKSWSTSADGLLINVRLREDAKFHDGSPVSSAAVADALRSTLPKTMGPAFEDVLQIDTPDDHNVRITLKRPAPFVLEALESSIQKRQQPGTNVVGTGPYIPSVATDSGMEAFGDYYLGRPTVSKLTVTPFPSVRAAWAELLRGNLDMLYDVGIDALDSMRFANTVAVFSFVRHYQYIIVFGPHVRGLESAEVRRELNAAIDRNALVREAFGTHGVPSTGPVSARHWALDQSVHRLTFDAHSAKNLPARHLQFTCLVPPDSLYERVALETQRQLSMLSVDMRLEEASQEKIIKAVREGNFDAALLDTVSGPSMFRLYQRWHTGGPFNPRSSNSPRIDGALDRIRHAPSEDEYRAGVAAFQQAVVDDPPALFLAWGERARAVSRRFVVPAQQDGRDALTTLRLWRPATVTQVASRN